MCKIKLGINNCFAVKRWPEPEEWVDIVTNKLKLNTVQFSLDLVDVTIDNASKARICDKINKAVKSNGLNIHSCFTGLAEYSRNLLLDPDEDMRKHAIMWYENAIEFASMLNCKAAGGHMGALSFYDYNNSDRKTYLIEILINEIKHLSKVAKSKGLEYLLWEPMPVDRELLSKLDKTIELYKKVNEVSEIPIYLNLDLGHMCCHSNSEYDRNPYNWIRSLALYSPIIHIQQCSGESDSHLPFTRTNNEKGIIEPKKVIDAINESGAKEVILIFEIIHPFEYDEKLVIDELKESVEYWNKFVF